MNIFRVIIVSLFLLPALAVATAEKEAQKQDPIATAMSGMSVVEQFCSGMATIDYSIYALRDAGEEKIAAATKIVNEILERYPDEEPISIKNMVASLTQDVYEHRSLHVDTMVAYHFFSCIEDVSSRSPVVLRDTRLKDRLIDVISCEAPGTNIYTCLMSVFGFDIPKEIKEGSAK